MGESISYNSKALGVRFLGTPSTDWIHELPFNKKIVLITDLRECESWSQLSPFSQQIINEEDPTLAYGMQEDEHRPPATIVQ